ncbi:hypothetical protein C3469_04355 [Mycobacterium kansasii]|uniref:hypothetical protein n=1 Tax=Mycobacterium kansasii TaxID=1768 RepID=UPI000CDD7ED9|nr:hypothetical protein [Mycobacterium kansasii]POY04853.1 hypothetical protein C3479_00155 [Mycobacterium kansasii]POY29134.1 hypothetical protein C3469_04355 [Mycobacterium kansasii]POY34241.1 hypothetical protein C3478_02275 [Mycobacterium kansasii]
MTWTKLGDEFADECWTLSDAAFRLHVEGLLWSNRMLTDGQLAKDDMPRWAHHPAAAEELTDRGYWQDCGGHFQIVHHLGYQPTAESVRKVSLANRANAEKRWGKRKPRSKPSSDSQCDSQCDMDGSGRVWTGLEKATNNVSVGTAENDYFTTLLASEPANDPDGFPFDERGRE